MNIPVHPHQLFALNNNNKIYKLLEWAGMSSLHPNHAVLPFHFHYPVNNMFPYCLTNRKLPISHRMLLFLFHIKTYLAYNLNYGLVSIMTLDLS